MTNEELAKKIILEIGGEENIKSLTHCATRLRFNLKNPSQANLNVISNLDGVLKAQNQNGQTQIIIGAKVQKIYQEILTLIKIDESTTGSDSEESHGKISAILETIAGIFTPAIPIIIGGGMIKAIVSIVTTYQLVNTEATELAILSMIGDLVFYFLPFFIALSSAKKFKTNEFIALGLAAGYMYPTILDAANNVAETGITTLSFFGLPILLTNYKSTVIPIILSVWLLSHINKLVNRLIPDFLQIIFSAMIVLLIMVPVQLIFIGPIGYYLGDYFAQFIGWFYTFGGVFSAFVLGGTRALATMVGMQYALGPLQIQEIAATGGSYILVCGLTANLAQAGAALGVSLRVKDKTMKSLAASSAFSAFLGIAEPAMFGVNLKYKRPFFFGMLASGIAAAFLSLFDTQGVAYAPPSLLVLPTYKSSSLLALIIGVLLATGLACVLTYFFGLPKELDSEEQEKSNVVNEAHLAIGSPVKGEVISLTSVNDEVFSQSLVGIGSAVIPSEGKIFAPFDGTVSVLFDSKHALGLISDTGIELLIHVGMDTVNLNGKYFKGMVRQGDHFKKDDVLLEFDIDKIKKSGYEITTPIIITNIDSYASIIPVQNGIISQGQLLLTAEVK